jgi:hypothetical protein
VMIGKAFSNSRKSRVVKTVGEFLYDFLDCVPFRIARVAFYLGLLGAEVCYVGLAPVVRPAEERLSGYARWASFRQNACQESIWVPL